MLFLDNNNITAQGAAFIADCLKSKQNLRVLNIDYNDIGPEGARFVAEQLRNNYGLSKLYCD